MQIREIIFKCIDMQIMQFIQDKIQTFYISHAFLALVVAKLPAAKNRPVFGQFCTAYPTPVSHYICAFYVRFYLLDCEIHKNIGHTKIWGFTVSYAIIQPHSCYKSDNLKKKNAH